MTVAASPSSPPASSALSSALPASTRPLATALPPWAWLLVGITLNAAVGLRWNMAALAWIAPVPWLLYLRQTTGWRARGWLVLATQVALFFQLSKIISDPIPWFFAPLFSVPSALSLALGLIAFEAMRRRLGDRWGLVLFPALAVVLEWVGWRTSEFGSWGAAAYTQIDHLALLQTTALLGLSGIALLIAAAAAWLALVLSDPEPRRWLPAAGIIAALLLAATAYGSIRMFTAQTGPMTMVAGVVSDLQLSPGHLPSNAEVVANNDQLFARSTLAAERGAKLVVWNEGATLAYPAGEAALLARAQHFATTYSIDFIAAYIVPTDATGAHFENKFVWMGPEGAVETYHKLHPVPGEGAVPGTVPGAVHQRPYGPVAGAICYDYDFPTLGLHHGRAGAGLVVVPSSDWRGIDPYHTQMARVRGIEGGFSVVRPVRAATSGAYDAYGRTRATLSWFEANDRVLLAQVPTRAVKTVYSVIGDALPWTCVMVLLWAIVLMLRGLRRPALTRRIEAV